MTKSQFVARPLFCDTHVPYNYRIIGEFRNRSGFDYVKISDINLVVGESSGSCAESLRIAEIRDKFFYFFHICDPDARGHKFGSNSNEYRQAIIDADLLLGKLMNKFSNGTVFIVTSDHGFNGFNHRNSPNTFIASNIILRNGYEVDIAPTIYDLLGIDNSFAPHLNGKSLHN